jgi:hypothetical protein
MGGVRRGDAGAVVVVVGGDMMQGLAAPGARCLTPAAVRRRLMLVASSMAKFASC